MRKYKCDAMAIGQRLKDARLSSKKGMTQLGFAEEIGVCVSNISKTEQGLRLPTIDLLFEYMNYFDKEANELLGSYGDGQNSIDSRLAKLPPEARQYLHGIFMDMIDITKCLVLNPKHARVSEKERERMLALIWDVICQYYGNEDFTQIFNAIATLALNEKCSNDSDLPF